MKKLTTHFVCLLVIACMAFGMATLAQAAEGDVAAVTIGGVTTNYTNIDEAFEAVFACDAEDEAVLKLLANCQRSGPFISSGCFTIDLNGFELSALSNYTIWMEGGAVRIMDSGATGSMAGIVGAYGGELTIEGGTFEDSVPCGDSGKLTIEGGTFTGASINSADASLTLYGGAYKFLGVFAGKIIPASILPEGYHVYNADGAIVALPDTLGSDWFELENVTVDTHHYTDGVCQCGYECPHDAYTDGICDACGHECTHDAVTGGVCDACGTQFVASLTIGENVTYYTSGDDVFTAAETAGKGTVTILADTRITKDYLLYSYANIHLIVSDGATLTLDAALYLDGSISGSGTITGSELLVFYPASTVTGITVSTNRMENNGTISGGTFTGGVKNTAGTVSGGTFSGPVDNRAAITGGTFSGGVLNTDPSDSNISGGTFNCKVTNAGGTVTGGIFNGELVNGVYNHTIYHSTLGQIHNTQDPTAFTLGENFSITHDGGEITCTSHIYADGACRLCSAECPHEAVTGRVCDACGMTCYGLYVGGQPVTVENLSGEGWEYTPAEGDGPAKLVLNNAAIGGEGATFRGAGIYDVGNDALVIELEGENTVTGASVDGEIETYSGIVGAIHSAGELTIRGSGTLNAQGYAFTSDQAGLSPASGDFYIGAGLFVRNKLTISGGNLNITGPWGAAVGFGGNSPVTVTGGNVNITATGFVPEVIGFMVGGDLLISGGDITVTSPRIALAGVSFDHHLLMHPMKITGGSLALHSTQDESDNPASLVFGILDVSGYENCQWRFSEDGVPNKAHILGWCNHLKIEPSDYTVTEMPSLENHFNMVIDGIGKDQEKAYEWLPATEYVLVPQLTGDGENQLVIDGLEEEYTYEDGFWITKERSEDFSANIPVEVGDRITVTMVPVDEYQEYVPITIMPYGSYVLEDGKYTVTVTQELMDLMAGPELPVQTAIYAKDPDTGMWDLVPAKLTLTVTRVGEAVEKPTPGETYVLCSHITDAEGAELYIADSPLFTFESYTHSGGEATCVSGKFCEVCGVEYDTALNPNNHAQADETGLCICGKQTVVSLTVGGKTSYYDHFARLHTGLRKMKETDVYTIKVYQDQTLDNSSGAINLYNGTGTLDLNGFTLHSGPVLLGGELTITDSSNGKGAIVEGGGYSISFYGGKLIFDASTDCLGSGDGHEAWLVKNYSDGNQTLGTDLVLPEGYLLVDRDTGLSITTLAPDVIGYPHVHAFSTEYTTDTQRHWLECDGCNVLSGEGDHADANKDHNCDVCAMEMTQCADENKDHKCDICGDVLSACTDEDTNYKCDICGKELENPAAIVKGVTRLAGADRLVTSYLVADQLKAKMGIEKFENIIVASGGTFADALPGSYLSAVKNAPILLTLAKDKYVNQTAEYIKANLVSGGTVYILGGESAVPKTMEAALNGINVKRVAGADRFGTNLAILKEAGVKAGDEILVCTAKEFADSLSASATGKPILLVYKKITDEQKAYLATLSSCKFTVVGGTTAVPDSIAKEMETYGAVTRLAGKDRLETSTMVAEKYFGEAKAAVVAYGWNFPDGLCGGSLAYAMDAPLILTHSKEKLYTFTAGYTTKAGIKDGFVLGGDGLVDDAATRAIFSMGSENITILK